MSAYFFSRGLDGKGDGSLPRSLPPEFDERVDRWIDERNWGGSVRVDLAAGWKIDYGSRSDHGFSTRNIREANWYIRNAKPCACNYCRLRIADRTLKRMAG